SVSVVRENGNKVTLSQLGRNFDPWRDALRTAMSNMLTHTQTVLKQADASLSPIALRKAAQIFKEGKAVSKTETDALAPTLWPALERTLCADREFKTNYEFLKNLSLPEKICAGFKRGLGQAGDYLFVLVPLAASNAAAFETAGLDANRPDGKKESRATYFFRLAGHAQYNELTARQDRDRAADSFIKTFNTCMSAVNFRRAPVFLSDEQLLQPRYEKYRFAAAVIPELAVLRGLFIGRVIHAENWKARVAELIKFAEARGPARWPGDEAEAEPDEEPASQNTTGG
ncbi:MAG: hypothetical protein PHW69_09355, partial [Elusimicrobiaceae bacterium]|nr:hypothetical protein [Elusimicrobiaceae bacterium]